MVGGVVLLLVATAAAAAAAGAGTGVAHAEDARYAIWHDRGSPTVHVIDDRGPDFTLTTPPDCEIAGLGGGRLLFDCDPPGDQREWIAHGIVVDLATRQATPLPDYYADRGGASAPDARFVGIGRHWAAISVSSYHVQYLAYMRTDGSRTLSVPDPGTPRRAARVVPDLDQPGLWKHLCGGLSVPLDPAFEPLDEYSDPLLPFSYQRPFLMTQRRAAGTSGDLLLQRCGRTRPLVLSRCDEGCTGWGLEGGRAIWFDLAHRVHLYALRTRAVTVWRLGGEEAVLGFTARLAVLRTADGRVLTRRLPGAGA
jgi:hypothetical protein